MAQTMNVTTAHADDGRHEICRDHVGQSLDRRAAPLRLADHLDDLGQQRFSPTRSARMTSVPVR